MRIINEKVATCYYKSTRTIVHNNHLKVITKEVELVFCECKAKSTLYYNTYWYFSSIKYAN